MPNSNIGNRIVLKEKNIARKQSCVFQKNITFADRF